MSTFAVVWDRIVEHAGERFHQKRGGQFTYEIRGNSVQPDRTTRTLHRSQFERAWARMPVNGPGDLNDLQGPAYLWSILTDSRIGPR